LFEGDLRGSARRAAGAAGGAAGGAGDVGVLGWEAARSAVRDDGRGARRGGQAGRWPPLPHRRPQRPRPPQRPNPPPLRPPTPRTLTRTLSPPPLPFNNKRRSSSILQISFFSFQHATFFLRFKFISFNNYIFTPFPIFLL